MTPKGKQAHPADPAVRDRERGAVVREGAQRTPRQRMMGSAASPRGPPDPDEEAAFEATCAVVAAALAQAITVEADAFSLERFCRRHGISLQMYYKLATQGLAPQTFNVGTRVLVSKESAARWRAEREAATLAEAAAQHATEHA